ncbi:uncharacterized protein [Henckelia pumila]|uniref:uncharacterized protein n=1 Tax=Henckelia pumila TaxID=405737 RepID=UPI003C6E7C7D
MVASGIDPWRCGGAAWLSAFRAAFACSIVGSVTLYCPESITRLIAFPAFSYATVIIIVTDATLGDTLRSCWLAFYGTVLGVCPAVLCLSLDGSGEAECRHHGCRAFSKGAVTEVIMHPVRVAASTAVGVVACVLALLFPFPRLAFFEVKENFKLYLENASERLKLLTKAFSSEDDKVPNGLISQAKFLNITATKLIRNIESKQDSMKWEPTMLFKPFQKNHWEKMRNLETALKGMEISLTNCTEFPVKKLSSELKNDVALTEKEFLNQVKIMAVEKTSQNMVTDSNFLQALQATQPVSPYVPSKQGSLTESEKKKESFFTKMKDKILITVSKRRLMQASRCSFSLGLAVLFGSIYSRDNGYWAGLIVAISYAAEREATFRVSNVKYQGTALGTVYGLMGCFLFDQAKLSLQELLFLLKFTSRRSLQMLHESVGSISLTSTSESRMEEMQKRLIIHVNELGKFIEEAEVEPNFWFLPFHGACYGKLKRSRKLENEYGKKKSSLDLELGKSSIASEIQCWSRFDDNEMKRSANSFLQHLDEIKNIMGVDKDGEKIKKEVVLSLGALFFCMNCVFKETIEIEKGIEELVQWENPSSQVDLHGILR